MTHTMRTTSDVIFFCFQLSNVKESEINHICPNIYHFCCSSFTSDVPSGSFIYVGKRMSNKMICLQVSDLDISWIGHSFSKARTKRFQTCIPQRKP